MLLRYQNKFIKNMKKQFTGEVVSTKMQKTIVIRVESKFRHPFYGKVLRTHRKFKAHNEIEGIKVGDVVTIEETRPISKEKNFIVVKTGKTDK